MKESYEFETNIAAAPDKVIGKGGLKVGGNETREFGSLAVGENAKNVKEVANVDNEAGEEMDEFDRETEEADRDIEAAAREERTAEKKAKNLERRSEIKTNLGIRSENKDEESSGNQGIKVMGNSRLSAREIKVNGGGVIVENGAEVEAGSLRADSLRVDRKSKVGYGKIDVLKKDIEPGARVEQRSDLNQKKKSF